MTRQANILRRLGGLGLTGVLAWSCVTAPVKKEAPPPPPVVKVDEPPPPPPEPSVQEKLDAAMKVYATRDWPKAREAFQKVLDKDSKNRDALLYTAVSYDLEGKLDDAIDAYKKLLEVDPKNEGALLNLGTLYRRRDRFEDAIKLYTKALDELPDDVKIRNNLGVVYRLDKKYDLAEKTLRRVLARAPGNVDAYKNMAVLFLDQNKLTLAEEFSVEAKKLEEKDGEAKDPGIWNNLGLIYFRMDDGKPARAMAAFREAAKIDPNDATAQMNIGAIAMRYRDYATAQASFKKATELTPNDPEAFEALGYALSGAHQDKDALAAFDKATELYGKDKCGIVWQVAMIHKYDGTNLTKTASDWKGDLDAINKYKAASCSDEAADKVDAEFKTADYMVKNPPSAAPPAPPPAVGAPPAPQGDGAAPAPAPAPAANAAPAAPAAPADGAAPAAPAAAPK